MCLSFVMKTQFSFFFCFALCYQIAVMSCLLGRSIIRPYDQRAPLSSTENFKTNNNKHFVKPAEPQEPASFICLPSVRSPRWDYDSFSRRRVQQCYQAIIPSVMESNSRSLLASVDGKKIMSIKLFHLPTTSHLG